MARAATETRFPEVGQAVQVRNRLATVRAVEPYDKGLFGPLILKRDGCHSWRPENFPKDDPRHGWTWDDCRNDAITLLGSEQALEAYIAQAVGGGRGSVDGEEEPTTSHQPPKQTSSAIPSPPTCSATNSVPKRSGDGDQCQHH